MMNSEFKIDGRTAPDICAQIKTLAASYTPEWKFDSADPDIGSVIALIYAKQMESNILRLNQTFAKFHTEFVNMLDMSLLPACPAQGIVTMGLIRDTVPGADVPKGTKLLGESETEELPVVFETCTDVHITGSRLRDIIAVSPASGKIISIMGDLRKARLFEKESDEEFAESEEFPVFSLFDFSMDGVERNLMALYHGNMFDMNRGADISVRMTDARSGHTLGQLLCNPERYRWLYLSDDGLTEFDSAEAADGAIVLKRQNGDSKTQLDGEMYSVIALEAIGPVREPLEIGAISLGSSCEDAPPAFVSHNTEELETGKFMPFGEMASIFDECYIGDDTLFDKQDALVTMTFTLSFKEKFVNISQEEENESLKIIKRKPRTVAFETVRTEVERVAIEYFNGMGWRRLQCERDMSMMFSGDNAGEIEIRFICPADWQPLVIGGHMGRCLRMRVAQADNCYLQPCLHRMPIIEGLKLRFKYHDGWKTPHRLMRICGTQIDDLTGEMLDEKPFAAFLPLPYAQNGLYLGFDRPMTGAPVSILFDVEQSVNFDGAALIFEYSTISGFKTLKIIDHTENLTRLGTVLFIPPADFAECEVEGVRRFWLRLSDRDGAYDTAETFRPLVRSIVLNAVEVHNVETLPQEEFYIDAVRPNMSFRLAAQNILSAEVFVNEKGLHSAAAMRRMAAAEPENVRIAYNYLGEVSEFFVRWQEVMSFDDSKPYDRHYRIDRMRNRIHFGDGINVMAPKAQNEEAFTVTVKCCRGEGGNLPQGAINMSMGRLLHIDNIENPIDTWSGSDIESIEKAHERGANIICSQNRICSPMDLLREARLYSPAIAKVRCVTGCDINGRVDERLISVVVMMRDYKNGSYSFAGIKDGLKKRLFEKSEATLGADMLIVTEPVYVEISVSVFAEISDPRETFAIQSAITEALERFIDPLSESGAYKWDIGTLPNESQIKLLLNSLRTPANIRRFMATARYADRNGIHECALSALKGSPFMLGVSGKHAVHLMLP